MKLPVTLPDGWFVENGSHGTVITGQDRNGIPGYVTVSEPLRAFSLGIAPPRPAKAPLYAGRGWKERLYLDAVAALRAALEL